MERSEMTGGVSKKCNDTPSVKLLLRSNLPPPSEREARLRGYIPEINRKFTTYMGIVHCGFEKIMI